MNTVPVQNFARHNLDFFKSLYLAIYNADSYLAAIQLHARAIKEVRYNVPMSEAANARAYFDEALRFYEIKEDTQEFKKQLAHKCKQLEKSPTPALAIKRSDRLIKFIYQNTSESCGYNRLYPSFDLFSRSALLAHSTSLFQSVLSRLSVGPV